MGIFSRITEIVNSNINAMLDKAEDPEKMVKLMIHEMEDTLTEVKSAAAEVVADKIRISRLLKGENEKRGGWGKKAQLAIEKGREDLAREAVERKLACEKKAQQLQARHDEIEKVVKQYQEDIARLEEKLASARGRQRTLIASHQSAINRKRVEEKIYQLNTSGAFAKFGNYENKIDRFNAEADIIHTSNTSLEKEFEDLTHNQEIEDELARLKSRMADEKKHVSSKKETEKPNLAKVKAVK